MVQKICAVPFPCISDLQFTNVSVQWTKKICSVPFLCISDLQFMLLYITL